MIHPRTRLRWRLGATAVVAVVLLPLALPILGVAVWLDNVGRAQELPRPRYGCWFWRLWWWYGYHGIYQLGWWTQRPA